MSFGNNENVIGVVALTDQLGTGGKVLEAGHRTDFRLFGVRQSIRHQRGLAENVLGKLFLLAAVGMDVLEQRFTVIGNQHQRLFTEVGAVRRVQALAQADQVTFLDVKQRLAVNLGVQQATFEQIQASGADMVVKIGHCIQLNGGVAGFEILEQLLRDALKRVDQLLGVRWLVAYQIHGRIPFFVVLTYCRVGMEYRLRRCGRYRLTLPQRGRLSST